MFQLFRIFIHIFAYFKWFWQTFIKKCQNLLKYAKILVCVFWASHPLLSWNTCFSLITLFLFFFQNSLFCYDTRNRYHYLYIVLILFFFFLESSNQEVYIKGTIPDIYIVKCFFIFFALVTKKSPLWIYIHHEILTTLIF